MKHSLVIFLFTMIAVTAFTQSCQITCSAYKQIYYMNGKWGKWPNHWSTYKSEQRPDLVLRITTLSEGKEGDYYHIKGFINGVLDFETITAYDPEKTSKMRKLWQNDNLDCYITKDGNYFYTQGASFKMLANNPTHWIRNKDAIIYFWLFSENIAIIVK